MVVNITSIYYQKQKLQSVLDQAVLLGTNYIDSNSYYNNSILNTLNLDENLVKQEISQHIRQIYNPSNINRLKIVVESNEVLVDILLIHDLPFEIPFKFVKINATSSAKLMLD